jgi:hypothetical protein
MRLSSSRAEQLESERDKAEREQAALIYDLREKLEFANSAKRRFVPVRTTTPVRTRTA